MEQEQVVVLLAEDIGRKDGANTQHTEFCARRRSHEMASEGSGKVGKTRNSFKCLQYAGNGLAVYWITA